MIDIDTSTATTPPEYFVDLFDRLEQIGARIVVGLGYDLFGLKIRALRQFAADITVEISMVEPKNWRWFHALRPDPVNLQHQGSQRPARSLRPAAWAGSTQPNLHTGPSATARRRHKRKRWIQQLRSKMGRA